MAAKRPREAELSSQGATANGRLRLNPDFSKSRAASPGEGDAPFPTWEAHAANQGSILGNRQHTFRQKGERR
jgi:hypothetical protein